MESTGGVVLRFPVSLEAGALVEVDVEQVGPEVKKS
jgi:hypothetical protein